MTQVWRALPADSDVDTLLDYLTPLIVKSKAEQQRFHEKREIYKQILERLSDAHGNDIPSSVKRPVSSPPLRSRYFVGSLLVGVIMSVLFILLVKPPKEVDPGTVTPPSSFQDTLLGCTDTLALNYDPQATIPCDTCCIYKPTERVGCLTKEALNYDHSAKVACDDCCEFAVRPSLISLVQRDSVSVAPVPPVFDYSLLELDPVQKSSWSLLAKYKSRLSYLIPILLFFLFLGWYLWRRARNDYLARQGRSDHPPYRLPIKIRRDNKMVLDERFSFVLDRLRGREAGERQKIDVPATIKATTRKGGFPDFRFRFLTRPTDYLVLINKQTEQNHQAQLFEYVFQHFVHQEVYAERFFFDGDPRLCWNESHPKGLALEQLLQRYGQARLLIFADGYSFIDPCTGLLEDWVRILQNWKHRSLLTPKATGNWTYRESRLNEAFLLLPASIDGMLQLVRSYDELSTPSLREWKYELEADDLAISVDEKAVVYSLRQQLSAEQLRWVAACAIYPELHWDLTLEIGGALRDDNDSLEFTAVRELARLSWFKEGHMPQHVRSQLLESNLLTTEEEQKVRAIIVGVLTDNMPENTNSYAYEEYQLHLAINQLLLSKMPLERQRWLIRYRQLHNRGLREDVVSMMAMDRQYNRQLDFILPKQLVRPLSSEHRLVMGWNSVVPLVLSFLLGVFTWSLVQMLPEPCGGQKAIMVDDNTTNYYCLANLQDSLSFYAMLSNRALDSSKYEQVRVHLDSVLRLGEEHFLDRDQELDTVVFRDYYFKPIFGKIWEKASTRFKNSGYHTAVGGYDYYLELANKAEEQLRGIAVYPEVSEATRQEWLGLSYLFAGQRERADTVLQAMNASNMQTGGSYPNLTTFLQYSYVDTAAYGRIRIRTKKGYYGFLDEQTGQPTWPSGQATAPYDHAHSFKVDNLKNDTTALITKDAQQCSVGLQEEIDVKNCFDQLIRFQNPRTQLYGYMNELDITIIAAQFVSAGEFTDDDLATVKRTEAGGYYYIRADGSPLKEDQVFDYARDFKNGMAAVQRNGKYGYLNSSGRLAIGYKYRTASDFNTRMQARVEEDSRSFTIDQYGNCIAGNCGLQEVQGRVLNAANGQPVAQAKVWVGDANRVTNATLKNEPLIRSNSQGQFSLSLSGNTETLQILVEATGFRDTILRRSVRRNIADIRLNKLKVVTTPPPPIPTCKFEGYAANVRCDIITRDGFYDRISAIGNNAGIVVSPHSVASPDGREGTICYGSDVDARRAAECMRDELAKLGFSMQIEACESGSPKLLNIYIN